MFVSQIHLLGVEQDVARHAPEFVEQGDGTWLDPSATTFVGECQDDIRTRGTCASVGAWKARVLAAGVLAMPPNIEPDARAAPWARSLERARLAAGVGRKLT